MRTANAVKSKLKAKTKTEKVGRDVLCSVLHSCLFPAENTSRQTVHGTANKSVNSSFQFLLCVATCVQQNNAPDLKVITLCSVCTSGGNLHPQLGRGSPSGPRGHGASNPGMPCGGEKCRLAFEAPYVQCTGPGRGPGPLSFGPQATFDV